MNGNAVVNREGNASALMDLTVWWLPYENGDLFIVLALFSLLIKG